MEADPVKDLLPDLSRPRTLFPERTFADALERLKEVDDGTRDMTPEEARHLWDLICRDIDQAPVVEASIKGRIAFYRDEIKRLDKFLDWQERYMINAMRTGGVEEIKGERFRAVIRQSVSYTVLDQPTVEDMANLPDCVETSLEWITPKPTATILNQIIAAFAETPDNVLAAKRKIRELLFAPASFSWSTLGNGHKAINNRLKKDPTTLKADRYHVTITDKLDIKGITNGKRPAAAKASVSGTQHRNGSDVVREVSEADRGSLAPPSDGRSDDADRYHGAASQPNYC